VTKLQNPLEQKVLAFIRENRMVTAGEKIVVAVSGGPDSVCLLHILYGLRRELGITLHIAHLNHRLRGAESDADAAYVAELARRLKIPATVESRDVRAYRVKNRLSLEEAAREVRYAFLAGVVRKAGAEKAAVGHTADDHVETVLMHLIRGSGLKGLRGLLPAAQQRISGYNLKVIRPLLELNHEDAVAYCTAHNFHPRADSTNLEMEPFRNKVRHRLLPGLARYNPRIKEAIARTARVASIDLDYIEKEARSVASKLISHEKGAVIIDRKGFLTLHPALQRQVLRSSIESLLGSLKDVESGHIEDIMGALEKPAGKTIALPFGLNFYIDYDRYVIAPDTASLCPLPSLEKEFSLKVPGETSASGWQIEASVLPPGDINADEAGGFTAYFDAAAAGENLTVRRRRPGDRFQPLGMARVKRLNRFMIDVRIPRAWRRCVPIVCAGKDILWVVGWRIGERYRVRPDTKEVLKLEFRPV